MAVVAIPIGDLSMADPRPPIDKTPQAAPSPTRPAVPEDLFPAPAGLHDEARSDAAAAAESDLWQGRTHWAHFLGRVTLLVGAVIAIVAGVVWGSSNWGWSGGTGFWAALVPSVVLIAIVGWPIFMAVLGNRYRLTTQRLFIERGILRTTLDQLELIRVDDVRVHKTLVDRFCGLGTVEIVSTDATDKRLLIEGIAGAERVAEDVRKRMRTMRKKSLFVENL